MAESRRYVPAALAGEVSTSDLSAFLLRELQRISVALAAKLDNPLETLHVAPVKTFEGLTVIADGTDWNPGSGQGVYTYYAGAWNKLG